MLDLGGQCSLGAGNLALLASHPASSHLDRNSEGLEGTLSAMVVVVTPEAVNVKSNSGALGEALQTMGHHLSAELAEELTLQPKVYNAIRSVREIDDSAGQSFVERGVGVAEASKTSGSAEGRGKGVPERNADIFGSVVVVNYNNEARQLSVNIWDRTK